MKFLPKLSLRDFLWLIVVVALSVLSWTDRRELESLRRQLNRAELAALRATEEIRALIRQRDALKFRPRQ